MEEIPKTVKGNEEEKEDLDLNFEDLEGNKDEKRVLQNEEEHTSERIRILDPERFLETQKKALKSTVREKNVIVFFKFNSNLSQNQEKE